MLSLPNAIITIPVTPSTPISFDLYTGEPIFPAPTVKTVRASLGEKNPPREVDLPGIDGTITYLAGRLIDLSPPELIVRNYYQISITLQTQTFDGRFYPVPTPVSRLGLDKAFGVAIYGWLIK